MENKEVIKLLETYVRENTQGNYLDQYIPKCNCCLATAAHSDEPVVHKENCIVGNCENEVYSKEAFKTPLERIQDRAKLNLERRKAFREQNPNYDPIKNLSEMFADKQYAEVVGEENTPQEKEKTFTLFTMDGYPDFSITNPNEAFTSVYCATNILASDDTSLKAWVKLGSICGQSGELYMIQKAWDSYNILQKHGLDLYAESLEDAIKLLVTAATDELIIKRKLDYC